MSATNSDARKRLDEEDRHHVHHDAGVREIVARARAAERGRIAQAIEDKASASSYRDPEAVTFAYLHAAEIARSGGAA